MKPKSDSKSETKLLSSQLKKMMMWGGGAGDRPQKRIYIIYKGSCRAMYSYIAASTSDLVRPRPSASDEPNHRSRGYIAVYSPPRPLIYITYIYTDCSFNFCSRFFD